jgi:hypothetical protein
LVLRPPLEACTRNENGDMLRLQEAADRWWDGVPNGAGDDRPGRGPSRRSRAKSGGCGGRTWEAYIQWIIEHMFATVSGVPPREDLERQRRSIALLAPGQPAGLTREAAMELLTELRTAQDELERLTAGLRRLLEGAVDASVDEGLS